MKNRCVRLAVDLILSPVNFIWLATLFAANFDSGSEIRAEDTIQVIDNFDQTSLKEKWTAIGKIRASTQKFDGDFAGATGNICTVVAEAETTFAVLPPKNVAAENRFDTLRFSVRAAEASSAKPQLFTVRFYSTERRAYRWRNVAIEKAEWQTIELPLEFFPHSRAATVPWNEAVRCAFYFPEGGTFEFDSIELVDREGVDSQLDIREISEFAFGNRSESTKGGGFVVISDAKPLEREKLATELQKMSERISSDLSLQEIDNIQVPLLIFSEEKQYREFFPKLGKALGAQLAPPQSDGFAAHDIAASFYDPNKGSLRPVFAHESVHSFLSQAFGISNSGEWLQEGFANYYQMIWMNESFESMAAQMVKRNPPKLKELLSGEPIGIPNYPWALMFVKWQIEDPVRKERFLNEIKAMKKNASTNFEPFLKDRETSWDELDKDYFQFLQSLAKAKK